MSSCLPYPTSISHIRCPANVYRIMKVFLRRERCAQCTFSEMLSILEVSSRFPEGVSIETTIKIIKKHFQMKKGIEAGHKELKQNQKSRLWYQGEHGYQMRKLAVQCGMVEREETRWNRLSHHAKEVQSPKKLRIIILRAWVLSFRSCSSGESGLQEDKRYTGDIAMEWENSLEI